MYRLKILLVLFLSFAVQAETIFETFDSDPSTAGWTNNGNSNTTFTYSVRYLDASICNDSANPARFYKTLTASYTESTEFWWQFDCQLQAGSDAWGRALLGVFNSANKEFLGSRFVTVTVGNRYDLWRQYSDSSYNNFTGPTPIPDNAMIRIKGHYWYSGGVGYAEMQVYDILTGALYGTTGTQTVVATSETLDYNTFGIGNRTDGSLSAPTKVKIDNMYFSTEGPCANSILPSFYSTMIETFEADPTSSGWINQSAGQTTFAYNFKGYLDALEIHNDSGNPARYYTLLPFDVNTNEEFWIEADLKILSESNSDYQRGLFGLFGNTVDNNSAFIGTRFAFDNHLGGPRYQRFDMVSFDSTGFQDDPKNTILDDANGLPYEHAARVKLHYFNDSGTKKCEMSLYSLEEDNKLLMHAEPNNFFTSGDDITFSYFGIGNRTASDYSEDFQSFEFDNFYFSVDGPNPLDLLPSFGDAEIATSTGLTDVFAIPKMDSLEVRTKISNATANDLPVYIRHRAYENEDMNNSPFLDVITSSLTVPAGIAQTYTTINTGLSPNIWSLENPNLYLLRTEVLDESMNLLYYEDNTIGFRTFEIVGKHFYLNGKPIYMMSFHMTPPGRIPIEVYNDPAFIAQHIQRFKDMNVKFVRIDASENTRPWLDACNRAGILVMSGCYSGEGVSDENAWLSNLTKLKTVMEEAKNYPCVVMWYLSNEWNLSNSALQEGAVKLYYAAKEIDDSRPMFHTWSAKYYSGGDIVESIGSDFLDYHPYTGWYYGSLYSLYNYHTNENFPVLVTECVGAYTNYDPNDGSFTLKGGVEDKYLSNLLRHIGHSYDLGSDSLWYQAYLTREIMEMQRRVRGPNSSMCGPQPFTYGYSYQCYNNPDDHNEIAKPVMTELAKVYTPLNISIRNTNPNHYAGDSFTAKLFVLNDDNINYYPALPATTLYVKLLDPYAQTVWENSYSIPAVNYYDTWSGDVTIDIPALAQKGTYTIYAYLNDGQNNIASRQEDIFVAQTSWTQVRNTAYSNIALYDSAAVTASELQFIGLNFQTITNFSGLSNYNYLIIGKDSFDSTVASAETQILDFINAGKRVLILEQNSSASETAFESSSWLGTGLNLASGGEDFVNIERPYLTNLMDDIQKSDFRIWNANNSTFPQNRNLFSKYFKYDDTNLDNMAVLANAGYHLYKPLLIELFPQNGTGGSCLLSQLNTINRFRDDPKAKKYLSNLIDYMLENDTHYQYVRVPYKINFGDFENERGLIFAPLRQGMDVAWGDLPYNYPGIGRNFRGQMKLDSWGGYILEDNPADTEKCPLYLRTCFDIGNDDLITDVENVYTSPLDYRLIINGYETNWITVNPGQRIQSNFTLPTIIPAGTNIKLEIEADEGLHVHGYSRGLVFHSLRLAAQQPCDYNGDCVINFADLKTLCDLWLQKGQDITDYDINTDNIINFIDYANFADIWMIDY